MFDNKHQISYILCFLSLHPTIFMYFYQNSSSIF